MFKALALTALAATTVGIAAAQARQIGSPQFPVVCSVYDATDVSSNFRNAPNGVKVATHRNGTHLGSPSGQAVDGQGRQWVQFGGYGWIIQSNLECNVAS